MFEIKNVIRKAFAVHAKGNHSLFQHTRTEQRGSRARGRAGVGRARRGPRGPRGPRFLSRADTGVRRCTVSFLCLRVSKTLSNHFFIKKKTLPLPLPTHSPPSDDAGCHGAARARWPSGVESGPPHAGLDFLHKGRGGETTTRTAGLSGREAPRQAELGALAEDRGRRGSAPGQGVRGYRAGGFPTSGRGPGRDAQIGGRAMGPPLLPMDMTIPVMLSRQPLSASGTPTTPSCVPCWPWLLPVPERRTPLWPPLLVPVCHLLPEAPSASASPGEPVPRLGRAPLAASRSSEGFTAYSSREIRPPECLRTTRTLCCFRAAHGTKPDFQRE